MRKNRQFSLKGKDATQRSYEKVALQADPGLDLQTVNELKDFP